VPGGDAAAMRLVLVSVAVSVLALVLSEWLARGLSRRMD
jgi:molybdate transport system permease protein